MGRPRAVSMDTTIYRGEGDTETEIEVEVIGMLEPYFSGSWDEPPSGGGVDDIQAIFRDGKKQFDISLTDSEIKEFQDQLAEQDMDYEPDYEPDYDPPDYED